MAPEENDLEIENIDSDPENLRDNDEIDDAEEAFMEGYDRDEDEDDESEKELEEEF